MNIRAAKLRGVQAAAEVHEELGLRDRFREFEQIDVFAAINDLGIPVFSSTTTWASVSTAPVAAICFSRAVRGCLKLAI